MYARNHATPETIAIGPVVQISDGAVQTTGCTVRIIPDGVAEGDGAGTTAYSTDGIVLYTPTQAETDYTSFLLIAKKTGCIPANITVVTTASATSGNVVLSPETHTSAVIPTVTTLTGHTAQTGDSFARIGAAGASLTAINLPNQTMDITGNLSGSVGSVTGAVGSVTGAVGSVTGHTNQTGDTYALANGATGFAAIDTVVDAVKVKTDFLPSATAGAAGGVFIAGSNAATSVTTALTANITGNVSGSVGSVTGAVGSVTGAVGSVTGSVGSVAGNVDGSTASVTGAVGSVTGAVGSVTGAVGSVTGAVGSVAGNVDGNVTGSVGSLVGHTVQTGDTYALANGTNGFVAIYDMAAYCTVVQVGALANPGTAAEKYDHTFGAVAYTATFSGLDSSGTRTTTTLSKV